MTNIEKLVLETCAGLTELSAALLSDLAAKSELMSIHLPGLSQKDKDELAQHSKLQITQSQQQKQNAQKLRTIVSQHS